MEGKMEDNQDAGNNDVQQDAPAEDQSQSQQQQPAEEQQQAPAQPAAQPQQQDDQPLRS
jgi:type IV secretory pathway VirB10-like protein